MSTRAAKLRVVLDGSNLGTEGRSEPSWSQLLEARDAFVAEHPGADVIVVVDATFEHRVAAGERAKVLQALADGDVVAPPAGAVGRGDAFILKIAERVSAVVLSNDSFQEFQTEHPWLFAEGRLIGGKPVRGVGWVFTPRLPVRAAKGAPKKAARVTPVADGPVKKPVKKVAKTAKATKATKTTKTTKTLKKAAKDAKAPVKKVAKKAAKVAPKPSNLGTPPAVALRRGRQPVNPESEFSLFQSTYKVGSRLEGEVTTFTSHGAVIKVRLRGAKTVECYAPNSNLGSPAPVRARDVLKRGDRRTFRLVTVDGERRIAELALL